MFRKLIVALVAMVASVHTYAQNPFLPLWEYIPDGEPYVFEDPDRPGKYRMYVYGSHDSLVKSYCGCEQVVWSAPVDDLTNWRYDGVILRVTHDAKGVQLHADGRGDVLFAPDVAMRVENGRKVYYLYPNNQEGGRQGMVAKSERPDGPFEVCNWNPQNPRECIGDLRFDPGVFVDDDGRVYAYWGFEESYMGELDPATMATVKPGTTPLHNAVSGRYQEGEFSFFEASSIRKVQDKYVFIYSRFTKDGEDGLPSSNYTLAYAYSDNPLGPWTYGGTIIDGRALAKDPVTGKLRPTAHSGGNTHGSIVEANGQWYVVYHRQCGLDEYSRQAMVAPITVNVQKGKGGKVAITQGEYTSEGFAIGGLNPFNRLAAGTACYYMGPKPARNEYPKFFFSGPYMQPTRIDLNTAYGTFSLKEPATPVVNCTDGSVLGYKYFNFDAFGKSKLSTFLRLHIKPMGIDGTVKIMVDSPYASEGGKEIGSFAISRDAPMTTTEVNAAVAGINGMKGKHALYFLFSSPVKERTMCEIFDLQFVR